jgi:enoyl-CoA hydratase/carnithine racemase
MDDLETLLYDEQDGVAVVTLNRPDVYNAFNRAMERELQQVWRSLRTNDDVRAIVLTGAGEKAFCTGIDREESISEYLDDPTADKRGKEKAGVVSTPFMFNDPGVFINPKQNDLWKPIVAAVNGMACGGAFYMLGESDVIIAAEHATFFDPHVSYGMVAGFETVHLLQKLPFGEMLRIALMGGTERMSAARAHQIGLVSEITPAGELMDQAMWIAQAIASAPPLAVQGTLRAAWLAHEHFRRDAVAQALGYIGWLRARPHVVAAHAVIIGLDQHRQVPWVLDTLDDGLVRVVHWADLGLPGQLAAELGV